MPGEFRDFLISDGFDEAHLQKCAVLPDEIDHDNIENNAVTHFAHSYKMEMKDGKPVWVAGDGMKKLEADCSQAIDFMKEGNLAMVRYFLAKSTHYCIDVLTYPHEHQGELWEKHHTPWETMMGHFLTAHQGEIGPLHSEPFSHIYRDMVGVARGAWQNGLNIGAALDAKTPINDDIWLATCRMCISAVMSMWATMAKDLKIGKEAI